MISIDKTDSSNECVLLPEPSYQISDPEKIPSFWMRPGKTTLFFSALSGYAIVYGKVAKMKKKISINNFIRA